MVFYKNGLFKNISFSMFANLVSLLISALVITLVPKTLDPIGYGFFQLYIFYTSYVGFFHFGWCDGIYLRYGGEYYDKLDKEKMSSQFWWLTSFEILITIFLMSTASVIGLEDKSIILSLAIFSIIFTIPKTMLSFVLQATNRIKEYSFTVIFEKIVFGISIVIISNITSNFYIYILADIFGKFISTILSIRYCSDIVFHKLDTLNNTVEEILLNVKVGIKLMLANIAGIMILGVSRLIIERNWSIEVFGKVSLAISLSSLIITFVNAIGIVFFPALKRIDLNKVAIIYERIRDVLMVFLFSSLLLSYPIKELFVIWLPKYKESLGYMTLLFPMCIYECKMSLLVSTYLKTYRKEKILLIVNVISFLISLVLSLTFSYLYKNLDLIIFSIFCVFAFRCIACEVSLLKIMNIKKNKELIIEFLMCFIFIASNYYTEGYYSFVIYLICLVIYLYYRKINCNKRIINTKN